MIRLTINSIGLPMKLAACGGRGAEIRSAAFGDGIGHTVGLYFKAIAGSTNGELGLYARTNIMSNRTARSGSLVFCLKGATAATG